MSKVVNADTGASILAIIMGTRVTAEDAETGEEVKISFNNKLDTIDQNVINMLESELK